VDAFQRDYNSSLQLASYLRDNIPAAELAKLEKMPGGLGGMEICLRMPGMIQRIESLLSNFTLQQLKDYVLVDKLLGMAERLDERYVSVYLEHYRFTSGVPERPLWKQCKDYVVNRVGQLVERVYIRHYFDPRLREDEVGGEMFTRVREAFRQMILEKEWLDDETKRVAEDKLMRMKLVVGFVDSVYNETQMEFIYGGLTLSEGGSLGRGRNFLIDLQCVKYSVVFSKTTGGTKHFLRVLCGGPNQVAIVLGYRL
jgi:predicted metalloendopeptidase